MRLTPAQRAALEDAMRNGGKITYSIRSNTGGARRRMLERMREACLVEGPPWKITGIGEDAIRERAAT